jgi:hypothetical protein
LLDEIQLYYRWCSPDSCHGDIIIQLLKSKNWQQYKHIIDQNYKHFRIKIKYKRMWYEIKIHTAICVWLQYRVCLYMLFIHIYTLVLSIFFYLKWILPFTTNSPWDIMCHVSTYINIIGICQPMLSCRIDQHIRWWNIMYS